MNCGEMRERVQVLSLQWEENTCQWQPIRTVWARAERKEKTNLFSKIGLGVPTVEFIVRRQAVTLHQALRWQGRHHFITGIQFVDRLHLRLTTAQVEPVACQQWIPRTTYNARNNPIESLEQGICFPGCLLEKYVAYRETIPSTVEDVTLLLITPKEVALSMGDTVVIGRQGYRLLARHELDEVKNEYEIAREVEP